MKTVVSTEYNATVDIYKFDIIDLPNLDQEVVWSYAYTINVKLGGVDAAGNVILYCPESLPYALQVRNIRDNGGRQLEITSANFDGQMKVVGSEPRVDIFGLIIDYKIRIALRT